jgi:two-component system nitrate/nitrite response regulator NarL
MITLLLVDDHPLLRQGVAQLIEMEEGLQVIGEAASGEEAIGKALSLDPDMILLDLNMKGMSGIETLKAMREQGITSRIVVFTMSDADDDVISALKAGADGYLLKDCEPEELLPALRQAANGQQVFSPKLAQIMAGALRGNIANSTYKPSELTSRELEIIKLLAQGKPNKLIARELNITEATVKVHVKNLLKKLSLNSRLEAALWAISNKLATVENPG